MNKVKLVTLLVATLWMVLIGLNLNGDIQISWIWLLCPLWLLPGIVLVTALMNTLIYSINEKVKDRVKENDKNEKHLEKGE